MANKDFQNGMVVGSILGDLLDDNIRIKNGYVVKFKIDDTDYYIASCREGESIAAPPTPTSSQEHSFFSGWYLNDTKIVFPYIPNSDVELTANFNTYNIFVKNNEVIAKFEGGGDTSTFTDIIPEGSGLIEGTTDLTCWMKAATGYIFPIVVTSNDRACIKRVGGYSTTTRTNNKITYNGHTYYYGEGAGFRNWTNETSELHRYKSSATNTADAALELLQMYFG